MQILRRLRRGQKDPNPYPVRCARRRKRPRPAAAGNEWHIWGRVHDKQDGRTADLLPHEYVDSLGEQKKRGKKPPLPPSQTLPLSPAFFHIHNTRDSVDNC